ncbi:MAG TPA: DMT family transporter [Burkholderiales bacterium]|nr:DMT family transporter [Burkholderiales bacterium]
MRYLPYLALLGAAALWGSNPVLGRLVGDDVPPITLSWLRWLVALTILAPLTWAQWREIATALRGHWRILVPLALLANVPRLDGSTLLAILYIAAGPTQAGTLAYSYGAERVDPVLAGVFIHFMPVFASLLAIASLGEQLHTYHLAGFALVFAGALLALGVWRLLSSPPQRTLSTTGKFHG